MHQRAADFVPSPPMGTVDEASLLLDAQFPWLATVFAARPKRKKS
jgi:hypothetical protein